VAKTTVEFDNVRLERVWGFVGGSLSGLPSDGSIPSLAVLGSSAISGTSWGQGWVAGDTASNPVYNPGYVVNPGDLALVNTIGTPADATGNEFIEQFFTVSGYTSLSLGWYWGGQYCTIPMMVEFFDAAGIQIGSSGPLVLGDFAASTGIDTTLTNQQTVTVPVPINASYCRWAFLNSPSLEGSPSVMVISNPTMTPTGTLGPSPTYLDGGWSTGGLSILATPGVGVQRSPDTSTWTTIRAPGKAASNYNAGPSSQAWAIAFTDYEFPINDYGDAETLTYRAVAQYPETTNVIQSPYGPEITLANPTSFAPSQWLLIDPLDSSSNIDLQVVAATSPTMEQDENQSVLMPAGRGRKVVIGDSAIFGDTITLTLQTISNAQFRALQVQLQKVYPLYLVSPDGEAWYVRMTKRSRTRQWQGHYVLPYRTYTLTMEQVDVVP
jgi:hypothetical protein